MKRISRLDYAYAVGRIRALERSLVSRAVFIEAAEEDEFSSALKVIFDSGQFSDEWTDITDLPGLDVFLEREGSGLERLIEELLPDSDLKAVLGSDRPDLALPAARRAGYPFVLDYLRQRIDLLNLKVFIRLRYLGLPRERMEKLVLRGGFLDDSVFARYFEAAGADFGDRIRSSDYSELWTRAIDSLEDKESFVELERGIEDFSMAYLKKARRIVFGPEPVFAYGLAKKLELRLIRILGTGKMTHIPIDLLKARISDTYV